MPARSRAIRTAIQTCAALVLLSVGASRPARSVGSHEHFVGPSGTRAAQGTRRDPWSLEWALAGADGRVHPGDTVWLLNGVYPGTEFRTELNGTPTARITFRQYPGARATIDGRLLARGAYLDFWGFEIMQSDPLAHPEIQLLDARTDHGRFINLILHDANTHGVNFWTPGVDAELYGCIVYNNGTHENLDHGTYVHNDSGVKRIEDNVFFLNYARGIQVYATPKNDVLRNVHVVGNVSFNNGIISNRSSHVNLLISAEARTEGMTAEDNMLFFSDNEGSNIRLGHYSPSFNGDIIVRNNYAAGGAIGLEMPVRWDRAVVEGNTWLGSGEMVRLPGGREPLAPALRWRDNRYGTDTRAPAWRVGAQRNDFEAFRRATGLGADDEVLGPAPFTPRVFVRPNRYEAGRAHIVIYNWDRRPVVPVNVAGVLHQGDRYEVRNVQALFGPPVASGTYRTGATIDIPMQGVKPPAPLGPRRSARPAPRTGPDFDVFLLTRPTP